MSAGAGSLDELRGPEWKRLFAAARRRLERDGWSLDGTIGLTAPDQAERRAVIGVTGRYRPETAKRITVGLADLDTALRTAYGEGLVAVLAHLGGALRDRPAERRTESAQRDQLRAALRGSRHADEPWYAAWAESIDTDGTLTRLLRRGDGHLLGWAVAVLDRLPAKELLPLPALAEHAIGDTKALIPGSPTAALALRALALRAGTDPPRDRAGQRLLWERFGAVADDLASQVLVLNIRAREDHVVADWLNDAADFGIPFRLTLQQLTLNPFTPCAKDLYVCENPAVLRAAAAELAQGSAPLVCTEGVPSAACRRLLDAAVRAGARLHVRADFDWAGLRIAGSLLDSPRSTHWRMSAADYRDALAQVTGAPLVGTPAASPWDPDLAEQLAVRNSAVMEERLLPLLLSDLTGPGGPTAQ
ncbi:TIGR02679 family protein [Streptacidiphilus sp. EB129]|uniref:TIGR02679 family protein n=1 Tax=Streptacidiphilus sp. EB129 TaxID=3156262 RepID=UPI0035159FD1